MLKSFNESEFAALKKFPEAAAEFCGFIEKLDSHDRRQFVEKLCLYLPRLCEVAVQLPDVEPATEGIDYKQEEVSLQSRNCVELSVLLRKKLGELDCYWDVFDPTGREDPGEASLSQDIAEIYFDLKDSLKLQSSDLEQNDIYWEWRFAFRCHWSRHAASALKVTLYVLNLA